LSELAASVVLSEFPYVYSRRWCLSITAGGWEPARRDAVLGGPIGDGGRLRNLVVEQAKRGLGLVEALQCQLAGGLAATVVA
jgi:hypothetical protein